MHKMDWVVWLGVVSGIASVVSLIFTIIETKKAKKAASEATKAKESIIGKESTLELKSILDAAGIIEQHLIKRTSPSPGSNQGHNAQKEHQMIEDLFLISRINIMIHLNG